MVTDKIASIYNKNYKKTLVLPILVLILSLAYIGYFYSQHGDVMHKDISLTGGTTITILSDKSPTELQTYLASNFSDITVRALSDSSGKQTQLIIQTSDSPDQITPSLEQFFGFSLTDKNSSTEFTGSSLSADFYRQLLVAVVLAFFWMSAVVFVIFSKKWKIKILAVILNILFGIFLGKFLLLLPVYVSAIILLAFAFVIIFVYLKYSAPAFAVMSCAFADIAMTFAVVDFFGLTISGAGIVAFLMLIGYSVDTDILLTTRVLTRKSSVNHAILGSFKTGMTMTLTAISAVAVALLFVYRFETALNQIFIILLVGLFFDMLNTWITNTALIKWFVERGIN